MDVVPGMLQGDTRGGQRSDRRGLHGEDRGDDHDGPERSGELTAGEWPDQAVAGFGRVGRVGRFGRLETRGVGHVV